jgi:hypothetical protein
MTPSKLPPPQTLDDQHEEFIFGQNGGRYIVEDIETKEILATGLTRRQTVEFTWLHAGRDYRIEPRTGTVHGDTGINQVVDLFGAEWDVYFKDGSDRAWRKSTITAFGPTERAAMIDLLEAGFQRKAWSKAFNVLEVSAIDQCWLDAYIARIPPIRGKSRQKPLRQQ